ncbi:MAG: PVC-type heme-binding CxxCH protein [Pirellulaceae bacterium]
MRGVRDRRSWRSWLISLVAGVFAAGTAPDRITAEPPRALDDRLRVELFAEHPQIVTPTGLAVDRQGRVFVAESHTHFRPDEYEGPAADRILILVDTDLDGRADRKTVFHEGFVHVMDLAFHADGSLYVATRKDIHRLRDRDGDDRADEVTPVVRLETKGNYPHNGLSGIAFDLQGGFHFGLGENLGEPYTLVGSDELRITGGGEGGSTYWVDDEGRRLRRVSTGWWNPYGMCVDSLGRVFGTDNDPDASPPCRLIQVVPDGDYGYEFRYGRSGRHPLIAWNGELPGTLPMIAGTGEAPCHIVAYESDALPEEYFGQLLMPSWADHRVERYVLTQPADAGFVTTQRETLVLGGDDFRPVGIDVAPDGTVYLSDWVSSSYTLHKQGRVWRIRPGMLPATSRPTDASEAVQVRDRRIREAAARQLVATAAGRETLHRMSKHASLAACRATCLQILGAAGEGAACAERLGDESETTEVRTVAARVASAGLSDRQAWQNSRLPVSVRVELLLGASEELAPGRLAEVLGTSDPLLRHAAVGALARHLNHADHLQRPLPRDLPPLALLLAARRTVVGNRQRAEELLAELLSSREPDVRLAAIKWVADEKLTRFEPQLQTLLSDPRQDLSTFLALHAALDRLANKPPTDRPAPARLLQKIFDDAAPPVVRRLALRLVDPVHPELRVSELAGLLKHDDELLRQEALWALAQHPDPARVPLLLGVARDANQSGNIRATAVAALAGSADGVRESLVQLAADTDVKVRDEALRSLLGVELTDAQRASLRPLGERPAAAEAVQRLVERALPARPVATDVAAWLHLLGNHGDVANGERLFRGLKIGTCAKCHQFEGAGAAVGPDLSRISQRLQHAGSSSREWLMATILQPSRDMAPQFTPWLIVTTSGQQFTGLPRRKGGTAEAYVGLDGKEFVLKKNDIESHRESPVSIMPADLLQQLTQQELTDLFAFLMHAARDK